MVSPAGSGQMTAEEPLTTKEGRRRFADRHTAMPELPGPAVLARMTARERAEHDEAWQAYHADLPLANTPVIQRVVATTRLLIQLNRHQVSARRGVIVSGPSGTGKTSALTQLGRTHERHIRKRHPEDDYRLPVIYVTVRPAATARMLAMEFARFLGLQFAGPVNLTDIVDAVCVTAARTRVELVCVDELHNLNLATRAGAEVSDQLKYFVERLSATFAYAGIDVESAGLFAGTRGPADRRPVHRHPGYPVRLRHRRPAGAVAGADRHHGLRAAAAPAPAQQPPPTGGIPLPPQWRHDRQLVPADPRRGDSGHRRWQRADHP